MDQIVALLRLAPDHRSESLKAARGIGGEWGPALRYALGGDAVCGSTCSLWVAAARARAPYDEDTRLVDWTGTSVQGADLPPLLTPRVSYQGRNHTLTVVSCRRGG